jgi:hypothetical protein
VDLKRLRTSERHIRSPVPPQVDRGHPHRASPAARFRRAPRGVSCAPAPVIARPRVVADRSSPTALRAEAADACSTRKPPPSKKRWGLLLPTMRPPRFERGTFGSGGESLALAGVDDCRKAKERRGNTPVGGGHRRCGLSPHLTPGILQIEQKSRTCRKLWSVGQKVRRQGNALCDGGTLARCASPSRTVPRSAPPTLPSTA